MTTLKELKKEYEGKYTDLEIYKAIGIGEHFPNHFHTDNCDSVYDTISENTEVGLYELMDEEDYNNTIMANCGDVADFEEWYGNKNAKILCVMIGE